MHGTNIVVESDTNGPIDPNGVGTGRRSDTGHVSDRCEGIARVSESVTLRRKLSALLMVDVSGFSRLMAQNEEGTTTRIQEFHTRTRTLVETYDGWVVDTAGDSVFGAFDSVLYAVRCAWAIQDAQAAVNAAYAPDRIETRMGVHLGDVLVQDAHVYGDGVNIAARLESIAEPGGIWVSEAVYQQVYDKLALVFEDVGVHALKNLARSLRIYRVVAPGCARPASGLTPSVWTAARLRLRPLLLLVLGVYLLVMPLMSVATGGVALAAGAVLTGLALGCLWSRHPR